MSETWLVLDTNYLCWRAFHTTGGLSFGEQDTGVIYGVLKSVIYFQDLFDTSRIIFCFDYGRSLRCRDYPEYKSTRRQEMSEEDMMTYQAIRLQINQLRANHLRSIGFRNVLYQHGYEADDLIAHTIPHLPAGHKAIIVSADHDLYQLLSPTVSLYNPTQKKIMTPKSFTNEYGVSPTQWVDVKAIAGCNSDNIKGIKGVGEKTAAKFINGKLKAQAKTFQDIVKGNKIWKHNRHLVKLPYPGLEPIVLRKDKVTQAKWRELALSLGMDSLTRSG